jgi:hypothetical protein
LKNRMQFGGKNNEWNRPFSRKTSRNLLWKRGRFSKNPRNSIQNWCCITQRPRTFPILSYLTQKR